MPSQQSHPLGFNDQTFLDPFLANNDSEENLVPIHSEHSPGRQSYYSPTPEHTLRSNDGRSSKSPVPVHHGPQISLTNGHNHTPSPPHAESGSHGDEYGFLSADQYLSDNTYNASSEHTATPEYEGFYLEDSYGPLRQPTQLQDSMSFENSLLNNGGDIDIAQMSNGHRLTVGTATLSSSHLMSPVLTDSPQISTREGTTSPPFQSSQVKQEPAPIRIDTVQQFYPVPQMQQTPTSIESSKGTSPVTAPSFPNIARAASPAIRIDQYARGDSPARQVFVGNGAKRSRAGSRSSYLAVQLDDESEDDEERFDQRGALDPEARQDVSSAEVSNFEDQDRAAEKALKNADVAQWIDGSVSGSEIPPDAQPRRLKEIGRRRRARSAGAQRLSQANLESLQTTPVDVDIPGPNILIDESSGEEESEESEDEGEAASIEDSPTATPTAGLNDIQGEAPPGEYDETSSQPRLNRAKPWQDPWYDSSDPGLRMQPVTSNDAMQRFEQRSGDIETVSRVATWGTRRMSESDVHSMFRRFTIKSEIIEEDQGDYGKKKQRERSGSFLQRFVPKRKPTLSRKESEKSKQDTPRPSLGEHARTGSGHGRHDSLSIPQRTTSGLKRMGSTKRPKTPRLDTGSAIASVAGSMAAWGGNQPTSATATSPPPGPWGAAKNVMKRSRSRSDLNKAGSGHSSTTELGLAQLWTKQGGPPMPTLAAPKTEEPAQKDEMEDDEDSDVEDSGVKMDLSIKYEPIVPTLEGFKTHVRQLNPRLPHFMFDRIAQEQLRRYKKLMDFKVKHLHAVNAGTCSSEKHCADLGGKPTYLPSKSSREGDIPQASFSVTGYGASEDEVNALQEGLVTPNQFPHGVPMPVVNRLPAEFECSLCFKVKKFQKPSDWSKHVHEDVQPFTCTFAQCADPKSFKRKADWVRHENERHRQLEWWQCNINDCSHRCYRKDNFVQHLVREHKLPEPKVKTMKAGKPAVRGPSAQKARSKAKENNDIPEELDQVWRLVEECKRETPKNPKDEACKFCGNVCNSWKKLTVHLAKHMEQISMPVLRIVKDINVTADTIISPIENRITSQTTSMSPVEQNGTDSPFGVNGVTMAEMPAGFTTVASHAGYFPDARFPRAVPQTYPQPDMHAHLFTAAYNQIRQSRPQQEGGYQQTHRAQFNPINTQSSSGPETISTSAYQNGDGFVYAPQQAFAASPITEDGPYQFGPMVTTAAYQQGVPAPTSYPQQQAQAELFRQEQQQHQQVQMRTAGYPACQVPGYFNGQVPVHVNGYAQIPNGAPTYAYP